MPYASSSLTPQALRKAMDLLLDKKVPEHANIRAALATAFQSLLRSAEYCGTKGNQQIRYKLRSDINSYGRQRWLNGVDTPVYSF